QDRVDLLGDRILFHLKTARGVAQHQYLHSKYKTSSLPLRFPEGKSATRGLCRGIDGPFVGLGRSGYNSLIILMNILPGSRCVNQVRRDSGLVLCGASAFILES
ncbi:hypothetical protein, partial [Serratia surfactantfaciens]|uniref:hypothetical protein n=1 Tax=Serratia surfactantfaciens TaxID=2741499 RepID=UPI001B3C4FC7